MGIRSADGPQPPVPPFLAGANASHNGMDVRTLRSVQIGERNLDLRKDDEQDPVRDAFPITSADKERELETFLTGC